MAKVHVTTTINGEPMEFLCEPGDTMLDALRGPLALTGSKEGCASGDCGACSITLDDRLVCSCLMLAAEAEGKDIRTIEGMARGDKFHPLQQKFLAMAAVHVGSCPAGRPWCQREISWTFRSTSRSCSASRTCAGCAAT